MTEFEKLPLESALEETPQVVSVVNIYSEDAKYLGNYIETLHQIAGQLVATHSKLTSIYQHLAQHLKSFKPTKYIPTSDPAGELSSNLRKFADIVSEMSSMEHICSTQISDGVVYPLAKCIETEFDDIHNLGPLYQASRDEVDRAIGRYSRCRRKESQQEKFEATEEVYNSRKNFHYLALQYYSRLNQLQMNRELSLLKPILCLVTAARGHHQLSQEFLSSSSIDQFLSSVGINLKSIAEDFQKEKIDTEELINSIVSQSQLTYYPQPPAELEQLTPEMPLAIKSGYLNVHRKYMGVMTSWERQFVFVEGGNLMVVPKNEFVGSLLLELDSTTLAHATDTDDRAHVFTVVTSKKSVILQALNDRERDEWMLTVQKLSKEGGYIKSDKPTQPSSLFSGVSQFFAEKLHGATATSTAADSGPVEPSSPTSNLKRSSPPSKSLRGVVIAKDAPIIFDLLPIMDDTKMIPGEEAERDEAFSPDSMDAAAIPEKTFSVHFLGCMEISVDTGHSVVCEVMRRILAARAIHNVFSTSHLSMSVNASHVALKDPSTNATKLKHRLKDVVFWASHSENQRLIGYIVGHEGVKGGPFSCYVFESDEGGKEVCSALGIAARQAYAHLLEQKTSQDKRKEETKLLLANIANLPDKDDFPQLSHEDDAPKPKEQVSIQSDKKAESDT